MSNEGRNAWLLLSLPFSLFISLLSLCALMIFLVLSQMRLFYSLFTSLPRLSSGINQPIYRMSFSVLLLGYDPLPSMPPHCPPLSITFSLALWGILVLRRSPVILFCRSMPQCHHYQSCLPHPLLDYTGVLYLSYFETHTPSLDHMTTTPTTTTTTSASAST